MSGSGGPPPSIKPPPPESVKLVAEKGRAERVQRLKATLEKRIENPIAVVDVLMAEAGDGDPRSDLWEQLHSAAMRDTLEAEVADAYVKCINGPRMKRLAPEAQADVLMHAADFFQGVRGDSAAAETYLHRVIALVPGHVDAFNRLERGLEKLLDTRRLLELYAAVASVPPKAVSVLATQAYNRVLQLGVKDRPLPDDACKKLVALVPSNPRLLDALEGHCRATKRAPLACALIEAALADDEAAPDVLIAQRRQRLLELYVGEANAPANAITHLEKLLERDPADPVAIKLGEKLLSTREVASRAAAALQTARRARSLVP